MNIVESIVNTYACMKLTSTSRASINIVNAIETTKDPPVAAAPNAAK